MAAPSGGAMTESSDKRFSVIRQMAGRRALKLEWHSTHAEVINMKSSVLLMSMLALSMAACGSREIRESKETVIEKPVVSQETREIVVERQVQPLRACTYGTTAYSSGSLVCQGTYQYQCVDGVWSGRALPC